MSNQDTKLTELRTNIGKKGITYQIEVDNWMIRQVVDSVGDRNPLWQDTEYAAGHRFGGVVAPPWILFAAIFARLEHETRPLVQTPYLDGGGEWEMYSPIRPGDTITVETELVDVYAREGKAGPVYYEVVETRWLNQDEQLVGKNLSTLITK